jgi:hypothetical protein
VRAAAERQQVAGVSIIHPAMQQAMQEHNLETSFFVALAARSPFVPRGRHWSYGKGLAAGARDDFDVAAVLLFPQFEHAVRELFFARGIVTTTSPGASSQNEHDLNKLLARDDLSTIFGPEQAFDLRVLLVEKAGANLRNDLAHGILDDGAKIGSKIYFWWLCLRLALIPMVAGAAQTTAPSDPLV